VTADRAVTAALEGLSAALADIGAPAMVIGGIAVIARGVPRTTLDIDATVWAEGLDIERALEVFRNCGFVARVSDARQFAEAHQVILLRHEASGTPVDVTLARLPFERDALAHASAVNFGGPTLPVAIAEDLIIYKAVAWRERDRDDIQRLIGAHSRDVDLPRVRALVAQFAELLEAPERLLEFDALVARVIGGS